MFCRQSYSYLIGSTVRRHDPALPVRKTYLVVPACSMFIYRPSIHHSFLLLFLFFFVVIRELVFRFCSSLLSVVSLSLSLSPWSIDWSIDRCFFLTRHAAAGTCLIVRFEWFILIQLTDRWVAGKTKRHGRKKIRIRAYSSTKRFKTLIYEYVYEKKFNWSTKYLVMKSLSFVCEQQEDFFIYLFILLFLFVLYKDSKS